MRKFGFENEFGTSFSQGMHFLDFPKFEYGEEIVESISVLGRAGELTIHTGRYTDTIITNLIEFESETLEEFEEKSEGIRKWLRKSKIISYTDKEDKYFVVKNVEISEVKRKYGFYGNVTFVFVCEPFAYYESGKQIIDHKELLCNPGIFSQPIYIITGEGMCNLTVNGKSVTANVGQNLTIDTERMISYREDGVLQNTAIKGNYEDLYLQEGDNKITVTDGFECKVIPRWRCL